MLRNVKPDRQIVVVLNQAFDSACAVLKIRGEALAFFCQLLDNIGNLDSIKCSLSQLFILPEQVLIDAFKLIDVLLELANDSICAFELLD